MVMIFFMYRMTPSVTNIVHVIVARVFFLHLLWDLRGCPKCPVRASVSRDVALSASTYQTRTVHTLMVVLVKQPLLSASIVPFLESCSSTIDLHHYP